MYINNEWGILVSEALVRVVLMFVYSTNSGINPGIIIIISYTNMPASALVPLLAKYKGNYAI